MRKTWTWLIVLLLALLPLMACTSTPKTEEPTVAPTAATGEEKPATEEKPAADVKYTQSPFFDEKVANGTLPPLEERLPKTPKLTNEIKLDFYEGGKMEIGKFGGTMRMFNPDVHWNPDVFLMLNEGVLVTPSILGEEITPNVFESFEVSDDEKEFTFTLREGLKWSDGVPVTMDDVKFAIDDVMFNEELNTAGVANRFRAGNVKTGTPMKVEYVDDWTFKVIFDQPYGCFVTNVALTGWVGYTELIKPAHALKKWHKAYGDLEEMKTEAGKRQLNWEKDGDWILVFNDVDVTNWELCNPQAIGFPVLYPWIQTENIDVTKIYERNPYYYKVDEAGQQLPYIDKISAQYVQDVEMVNMKVLGGEVDLLREDASTAKMPLYRDNAKNGFTAYMLKTHVNSTTIFFNQTYGDSAYRDVVQDLKFRQALSYATDYKEVIDAIYMGFADLPNLQNSTFDQAQANKLLDEMGMAKGSDGMRSAKDGSKISFEITLQLAAPEQPEVADMVSQQWKDVGVNVSSRVIAGNLMTERDNANEIQFSCGWLPEPMWGSAGWTDFADVGARAGRLWGLWVTSNGENGEEPPEYVKRMGAILGDIMATNPGSTEFKAYFDEVYKLYNDNVVLIQIGSNFLQPLLLNSDMGNVPIDGMCVAVNIGGEQLFYRNPEQH